MRQFPRPERYEKRLGNVLPDVSGEIDTERPKAKGTPAKGVPLPHPEQLPQDR